MVCVRLNGQITTDEVKIHVDNVNYLNITCLSVESWSAPAAVI